MRQYFNISLFNLLTLILNLGISSFLIISLFWQFLKCYWFNIVLQKLQDATRRSTRHMSKANTSDTNTFILDSNKYQCFPCCTKTSFTRFFASNVSFIYFHFSQKQITSRSHHCTTQLVQPCPCCSVTTQTKHPFQSQSTCTIHLHIKCDRFYA